MERDVLVLMRCIYRANRAQEKTTFLNEFLDNFEILKLEIRVCVDLKLVSIKRQSVLAALMNSIGKQVYLYLQFAGYLSSVGRAKD